MAIASFDKSILSDTGRISRYMTIAIVIFALIMLTLLIHTNYKTLNRETAASNSASATKGSPTLSYKVSDITQNALFGEPAAVNNADNLPQTRLQLTLRGAFTASDPKQASAIIEGPDGKSRSFKVESKVYGGATLYSVHGDKVVLSHDGRLENLYFPTPESAAAQLAGLDEESSQRTIPPSGDSSPANRSNAVSNESERQNLIRARLQELRERARNKG